MKTKTPEKENPIKWLFRYVSEARNEMKKVTWPTRKETLKYSIIVIVLCLIIAGFFGGLDWLLNLGLEQLIALTS